MLRAFDNNNLPNDLVKSKLIGPLMVSACHAIFLISQAFFPIDTGPQTNRREYFTTPIARNWMISSFSTIPLLQLRADSRASGVCRIR
jgi:hypothetical protein